MLFVIVAYFVFFGAPLGLDLVLGRPSYHDYPGFYLAAGDSTTSVLYCLFVSGAVVILWTVGRGRATPPSGERFERDTESLVQLTRRFRPLLLMVVVLPVLVLFFAPNPSIYLTYGIATQLVPGSPDITYYELIAGASLLSLLAAVGLLASFRRVTVTNCVLLTAPILLDIWLYGKRSQVAESLLLFGYILWLRGYLRGRKLIGIGLIAVAGFGLFSMLYQQNVRGFLEKSQTAQRRYDETRIDYARDEETRLAIYAQLHPEQVKILEYPGESFLFDLTQFVPRVFWPNKPYPYSVYMTSASFLSPPTSWGWGVTTSILDEAIANFGWFGVLFGPLVLCAVCRLGDACRNGIARPLTVLIACLLLVVQLQPFAPLMYVWIVIILHDMWTRSGTQRGTQSRTCRAATPPGMKTLTADASWRPWGYFQDRVPVRVPAPQATPSRTGPRRYP